MSTRTSPPTRALEWWYSIIVNEVVLENYADPVEAFKMVRRLEEAIGGECHLDIHLVDALGRKAWAFCEREYQAARAGR